jgi:hypothetical protein
LCNSKIYNTFHTLIKEILSYDTDEAHLIFTIDERKIMDSCLQPVSLPVPPEAYYPLKDFGVSVIIKKPAFFTKKEVL